MATVIDTVTPELKERLKKLRNRSSINKVMARKGAELVRAHFIENGARFKNKFGKPPMFWKKMFRAVRSESDAKSGSIVMERAVAQKYFGGVIRPTGGRKFLTIPLTKQAYRTSARSFKNLFVVTFEKGKGLGGKNGRAYLARYYEFKKAQGYGEEIELMYMLLKRVNQKGDKSVLPPIEKIKEAAAQGVKEYLEDLGK